MPRSTEICPACNLGAQISKGALCCAAACWFRRRSRRSRRAQATSSWSQDEARHGSRAVSEFRFRSPARGPARALCGARRAHLAARVHASGDFRVWARRHAAASADAGCRPANARPRTAKTKRESNSSSLIDVSLHCAIHAATIANSDAGRDRVRRGWTKPALEHEISADTALTFVRALFLVWPAGFAATRTS